MRSAKKQPPPVVFVSSRGSIGLITEKYVALVEVKGKQIKKSLNTNDRQLANRRLEELRAKGAETAPR